MGQVNSCFKQSFNAGVIRSRSKLPDYIPSVCLEPSANKICKNKIRTDNKLQGRETTAAAGTVSSRSYSSGESPLLCYDNPTFYSQTYFQPFLKGCDNIDDTTLTVRFVERSAHHDYKPGVCNDTYDQDSDLIQATPSDGSNVKPGDDTNVPDRNAEMILTRHCDTDESSNTGYSYEGDSSHTTMTREPEDGSPQGVVETSKIRLLKGGTPLKLRAGGVSIVRGLLLSPTPSQQLDNIGLHQQAESKLGAVRVIEPHGLSHSTCSCHRHVQDMVHVSSRFRSSGSPYVLPAEPFLQKLRQATALQRNGLDSASMGLLTYPSWGSSDTSILSTDAPTSLTWAGGISSCIPAVGIWDKMSEQCILYEITPRPRGSVTLFTWAVAASFGLLPYGVTVREIQALEWGTTSLSALSTLHCANPPHAHRGLSPHSWVLMDGLTGSAAQSRLAMHEMPYDLTIDDEFASNLIGSEALNYVGPTADFWSCELAVKAEANGVKGDIGEMLASDILSWARTMAFVLCSEGIIESENGCHVANNDGRFGTFCATKVPNSGNSHCLSLSITLHSVLRAIESAPLADARPSCRDLLCLPLFSGQYALTSEEGMMEFVIDMSNKALQRSSESGLFIQELENVIQMSYMQEDLTGEEGRDWKRQVDEGIWALFLQLSGRSEDHYNGFSVRSLIEFVHDILLEAAADPQDFCFQAAVQQVMGVACSPIINHKGRVPRSQAGLVLGYLLNLWPTLVLTLILWSGHHDPTLQRSNSGQAMLKAMQQCKLVWKPDTGHPHSNTF